MTYLLFDLDETLYPSSAGIVAEISRRMTRFVAEYLGVDERSAAGIRRRLSERYGATLIGLMKEHGLRDPEPYLAYTHPVDVERYLQRDPELAGALQSIPLPKSILTNAPREHAQRVLHFLGIDALFQRIFDIRFNAFRGKPDRELYRKVLAELGRPAAEVLFVDNRLDYLLAFRDLGGRILWVAAPEEAAAAGQLRSVPRISEVKELPAFLTASRAGATGAHRRL